MAEKTLKFSEREILFLSRGLEERIEATNEAIKKNEKRAKPCRVTHDMHSILLDETKSLLTKLNA